MSRPADQPDPVPGRQARVSLSSRVRSVVDWWLRDPRTGRVTVVQWPNPALWVWALAAATSALGLLDERATEIRWIGTGALIAWAADEVLRGVSPARRTLGLVVLVVQVSRLLTG